jgi:hypothetical protein
MCVGYLCHFDHDVMMYGTYGMLRDGVITGVMGHRRWCVMDLRQVSWQGSCASRTHKCPMLSMFPRYRYLRDVSRVACGVGMQTALGICASGMHNFPAKTPASDP